MAINKRIIRSNDDAATGASFNTVTWTGDGASTRSITGVGFQPDLVWTKRRSSTDDHHLFDVVRGTDVELRSNSTNAELTSSFGNLSSYDIDGFTVTAGVNGNLNQNALDLDVVAWCWKAGGSAVTNTDGTITSQVSANVAAGFSIVSYTGNGVVSTVGHGLNAAPKVIIAKNRNDGAEAWPVYHSDLGKDKVLTLNTTDAEAVISNYWGTNGVDNSVFGITSSAFESINQNGSGFIAYCFAEVAGFSKFGSYTGTGAAGNFQNCGFEPAFVMIKISSAVGNWRMWDNKRSSSDPRDRVLIANGINSEFYPDISINFTSTGFSFNTSGSNDSGQTFIYMAFANQF